MARDRKRVDVLILGAGAAGLAAARDLSHAGLRVTIIEARPRVGGRILTLHDSRSPVPLELGAEFIHGERAETLSLAQAAGLAVLELPDTHELAAAGRIKAMDGFWQLVDRMNHDLARRLVRRGRDFPVSEYLDSRSVPPSRRGMLRDFLQGFYAAHPDRLSAESLAVEARGGGSAERDEVAGGQFRIANGGDALMKWLRDGLDPDRTELRLSTVAQSVEWKGGAVRVACRGADRAPLPTVSARSAVVTLPLAVLKAGVVRFDPALPAKRRALAGLETGQVFKIVLRFRNAFWDDAEFLKERRGPSGTDRGGLNFLHGQGAEVPTWWTTLPVRSPVLVGYVGAVAAEQLLAEEPPSRLERTLVALSELLAVPRRDLEDQLDASASHDWRADPFARGAYSYIGVGGIGAPRALARPVEGTLFFAGEATDGPQIGTVAGALASGRRAAREVLRVLQ
ncbi:MAG TPA: NAD(P)/FAD-dependent oxidoreductase [Gemmatimonadales bacterium]|nr:NAD(P)/FAD-dependent oxidoreductase [Gemmatimonadales bacterium]